jgi:glutaminase
MSPEATTVTSPIQEYLERLHAKYAELRDGTIATYIPELAKANPSWFGVVIGTVDGRLYEVGDTRQPFTIQSISKPFTYGLALEDRGLDAVLAKIGVEPTGDAFNSISLAPGTGCPLNPMINAGAIATSSLVAGRSPEDRLERLIGVFSTYAGRRLTLDQAVFESERSTGHRNRAIGHMLRNFDVLTEDPNPALDLYFQQCSISVDCRDLAVMAATLANGGMNPVTGERAIRPEFVPRMLSVMTTCGMYDYAGEWVYWVGMPAKSGVAGGVLAVLPGQFGIGVFSPLLDSRGNSVRGVAVCKSLSTELSLHLMRVPRSARAAVRIQSTLQQVSSKRLRSERERGFLDGAGKEVCVLELQGDLSFAGAEAAVHRVVAASRAARLVVVDLRRVSAIEECAVHLLADLERRCASAGGQVIFSSAHEHSRFLRYLEEQHPERPPVVFADLDHALEWCETRLLAAGAIGTDAKRAIALRDHDVCRGLTDAELVRFERLVERRAFPPGTVIVRRGDEAEEIYLLASGEVSVVVDLPSGQRKRLSTLSPGMAFGELAVVSRGARQADVRADTPVECWVLRTSVFDELGESDPRIKMRILENLLRNVSQMLVRSNRELTALSE